MRQLLVAAALSLAACSSPRPAPTTDAQASPAARKELKTVDAELAALETDIAVAGTTGTQAGWLYERRGDLLASAGRNDEAIAAYDEAARAYGQSPEATTMPVVRSDRAREKAEKLRKQAPGRRP